MLTSNIAITKLISWKEIDFSESWTIQNVVPPTPILNVSVEQIMKTREGDVILNFRKNLSQFPMSLSSRSISTQGLLTRNRNLPYRIAIPSISTRHSISKSEPRAEMEDNILVEGGIISSNQIPRGIYQEQPIRRISPTASEVNFNV